MAKRDLKPDFKLGIVGASGYAGQVLHALFMHHPRITPVLARGRTPGDLDAAGRAELRACALAALALPRDAATQWSGALADAGVEKILDLSDARRRDSGIHQGADLLGQQKNE